MSDQRQPDPRLLAAALRDRRLWRYYRIEYDELKKFTEREADRADRAEAERDRLAAEVERLRAGLGALDSWLDEQIAEAEDYLGQYELGSNARGAHQTRGELRYLLRTKAKVGAALAEAPTPAPLNRYSPHYDHDEGRVVMSIDTEGSWVHIASIRPTPAREEK